jgi:hypothetical protein
MTKQYFYYTEKKRTISRTYGGSDYTLNIYESKRGNMVHIGEVSACTRGHKGEESEVYTKIIELGKIKPAIMDLIKKAIADPKNKNYNYEHYYTRSMGDKFGLIIKSL